MYVHSHTCLSCMFVVVGLCERCSMYLVVGIVYTLTLVAFAFVVFAFSISFLLNVFVFIAFAYGF